MLLMSLVLRVGCCEACLDGRRAARSKSCTSVDREAMLRHGTNCWESQLSVLFV